MIISHVVSHRSAVSDRAGRPRRSRASAGVEALVLRSVSCCRSRRRASAGREALAARRHGQPAGGETRILEFRVACCAGIHMAGAEFAA